MWRYLMGGLAVVALIAAVVVLSARNSSSVTALPAAPAEQAHNDAALPDHVPEASDRTREQKRFDRYDKDRDGSVTREEYLVARRKAFAKLDANQDGTLSFDEWAMKAEAKFALADADKSGAMTRGEFAATAVTRKPPRVKRDCPPASAESATANEDS